MTVDEALLFLSQHQPMPPDSELTEDLIKKYDDVRNFFLMYQDVRCVSLLLHSFGDGNGFGVYQLVEDVIRQYTPEVVIPPLLDGIKSSQFGIRYWCIQIAALFPNEALVPDLSLALADSDVNIRIEAVTALFRIKSPTVDIILRNALLRENEEDIRDHIRSALGLV